MSPLMIVANPRKKKHRRKAAASGTPKKKRRHHARRKKAASFPMQLSAAKNPRKRRSKKKRAFSFFAKKNPRHIRRNPIGSAGSLIEAVVEPAAIGAAGAVGASIVMGMLRPSLPANLQTGLMGQAVKAGVILVLGALGEHVFPKDVAHAATVGALTIVGYNTAIGLLAARNPNLVLGKQLAANQRRRVNALETPNGLSMPNVLSRQLAGNMPRVDMNVNAIPSVPATVPAHNPIRRGRAFGSHAY